MDTVRVNKKRLGRVCQGDVFKNIEHIEYVTEKNGIIEVGKIVFPLVIVLTQECDLTQAAFYNIKSKNRPSNDDKVLISVLIAPLYNAEHVFRGEHLDDLGLEMAQINRNRSPGKDLIKNERPRYHYLKFPDDTPIVPSVVDFKHYFSVGLAYLQTCRYENFICRLSELYREDLSQRFAWYLSRIGLPDSAQSKGRAPQPALQ